MCLCGCWFGQQIHVLPALSLPPLPPTLKFCYFSSSDLTKVHPCSCLQKYQTIYNMCITSTAIAATPHTANTSTTVLSLLRHNWWGYIHVCTYRRETHLWRIVTSNDVAAVFHTAITSTTTTATNFGSNNTICTMVSPTFGLPTPTLTPSPTSSTLPLPSLTTTLA